MKFKGFQFIIVIAMVLTLALTGCGQSSTPPANSEGTESPAPNEGANQETEASYPITIRHAFGETVIETKPERIATISWGNQDLPLALGVVPVGISEANYGVTDGSRLLPWTAAKFKELGIDNPVLFSDSAGLDFEAINDVQPDVILAAYSGLTPEEYALLSEIAPVIAYPTNPWETLWRDQIVMDAAGMGMKEEGEVLVKDLEALIEAKTSEYPQISGKTAAFFYFVPTDLGKFYVYLPTDPRMAYLSDLGMPVPESVKKLAASNTGFALEISAENIDQISDIDIVIAYGHDSLLAALQADSLLGTMPAIQRGSVALIEDGTPLAASGTPSALSIPATIDEYLSIIGEAADKVQ